MKKDLDQAVEAVVEPIKQDATEDKERKEEPQSSDLQEMRDFLDCL